MFLVEGWAQNAEMTPTPGPGNSKTTLGTHNLVHHTRDSRIFFESGLALLLRQESQDRELLGIDDRPAPEDLIPAPRLQTINLLLPVL